MKSPGVLKARICCHTNLALRKLKSFLRDDPTHHLVHILKLTFPVEILGLSHCFPDCHCLGSDASTTPPNKQKRNNILNMLLRSSNRIIF